MTPTPPAAARCEACEKVTTRIGTTVYAGTHLDELHALLAQRTTERDDFEGLYLQASSTAIAVIRERDEAREALRKLVESTYGSPDTLLCVGDEELAEARRVLGKEGSG